MLAYKNTNTNTNACTNTKPINKDALLGAVPVVGESTRVAPPFDGWRSAGAAAVGGKLPKQKVAAGFHFLCEGAGF